MSSQKEKNFKNKNSNNVQNNSYTHSLGASGNSSNNIINTTSSASTLPAKRLISHPFKADFNDHFETSLAALRDVKPAIEELRQLTRPSTPECFTLYDPYYCNGTVVQHWHSLGFTRVLHDNRDFYADIDQDTVPGPFDMLVTNPPFGENHLKRLLSYLVTTNTPWAFLAPDYVATKPWYREFVTAHFTLVGAKNVSGSRSKCNQAVAPPVAPPLPPFLLRKHCPEEETNNKEHDQLTSTQKEQGTLQITSSPSSVDKVGLEPFYIIPRNRYDYEHPVGAGHAHSHFKSMWYVFTAKRTNEVIRATQIGLLHQYLNEQSTPMVIHGLSALQEHTHRLLKRSRSHKK